MIFLLIALGAACPDICNSTIVDDGICETACYNDECSLDQNDCSCQCALPLSSNCVSQCATATCASSCLLTSVGDNICDFSCDVLACNYDDGDCSGYCSQGCLNTDLGNGVCNSDCNNLLCNYDSGDCSSHTNTTVIVVLTVVGFVLVGLAFFCICTIIYFLVRKRSLIPPHSEIYGISETSPALTDKAITTRYPELDFDSQLLEFEERTCVVCLDEMKYDSKVRKLPCKHMFHSKCVTEWLVHNIMRPRCPT